MFKIKKLEVACGEPARQRVPDPSVAASSSPRSSPVGCCGRGERLQHCEDARRWDNEFIAACHPAMAISTIRHCTLPLKGRASPTTPTLPGPRLIRWGRAHGEEEGDLGKGDQEGRRDQDLARWKEGERRERKWDKKYLSRKTRKFPWPHLKPRQLRVPVIFHNQSGWLTLAYLIF